MRASGQTQDFAGNSEQQAIQAKTDRQGKKDPRGSDTCNSASRFFDHVN
jgi:hypothetical protein